MQLQLPKPSADALASSRSLHNLIADEINRHAGWISFARYMELTLYAPGLGYYSGGAAKLGKDGDFTTAPEITPLFGASLAHVAAEVLKQTKPNILEFGAGSGKLARDFLTECKEINLPIERYCIIEVSGELRARQQRILQDFPQVEWLDQLPSAFSGLVIGNEVLDAMPVRLVVKTEQGWQERGVTLANANTFIFSDRPCDAQLIGQIPNADALPEGYLTEVHPVAIGFMRALAGMLRSSQGQGSLGSAALLIDYGFPAREYYLDQRSQGTLMCHYRHHAHPDPFYLPGLQDITAHVDFTAMARAALDSGLSLLTYTSQAAFLLNAGIGDLLLRTPPTEQLRYLPQSNAVQRLISPAEMGELFKVLLIGNEVKMPEKFIRGDRSHRL